MKQVRTLGAAGILIGTLACFLVCGAAIGAGADEALPLTPTLENSYCVGDTIELKDIGIEAEGRILQASPVVYSPKGDVASTYEYTVEYPGTYRVDYVATANGKRYAKSYSFDSLLPAFSTKNGSLAEYGEHTKTYLAGYLKSPFDKNATDIYEVEKEGIYLDLSANDVFTYNKVLNLDDLRETPFLTFTMLPEEGERDVEFIDITLTDAYDSSIVMSVQISTGKTNANNIDYPNSWTIYSYLMAKTGMQTYCGLGDSGEPNFGLNGHIYGSLARFGMYGNRSGRNWQNEEFLSLTYDCEEMQLFQNSLAGEKLVCDFDNSQHFDTPFKGFTSNEVILSVSMRNCYTSGMKMVITAIGDNDLSLDYVEGFPKPNISVKTESAPEAAIVGYGYPVPAATANCPYTGSIAPEVKAYFAYGSDSQFDVPVTNGYFYPKNEGRYTLIYSAKSVSGEIAQKRLDIIAHTNNYQELSFLETEDLTRFVGEKITLSAPETTGGIGAVKVSADVRLGEERIELHKDAFVPERAGDYVVEWTATDVLGREAKSSYTIVVSCSDKPIIDEDAILLPKYFIKGYSYSVPQASAFVYSEGNKMESTVTVTATGGTLANGKFTAAETGVATLTFTATNGSETATLVREVPVLDVESGEGIDIGKYFAVQNLTIEKTENYTEFALANPTETGRLEFINKFIADGFFVTAVVPTKADNGTRLDISLTDIYGDGSVALALIKTSTGTVLTYNGEQKYLFTPSENITLTYRRSENRIYASNTVSFELNGFEGFASGYCYFATEISGAKEAAYVRLVSLAGQGITNIDYDAVSPNVAVEKDYEFNGIFGGTVTVYKALAADALDPNTNTTVTVRNPNGEIVVAQDGTRLENVSADKAYEFTTDMYGYFTMRYEATCSNGQTQRETYSVMINDTVAPELNVTEAVPAALKVGDSWRVAAIEASDNVTEADNITVLCVITHLDTHDMNVYRSGATCVFAKAGRYVVSFVASDESGNVTTKEFVLTVTE